MTRYERNLRRRAAWSRRWYIGPMSYVDRLRAAAYDGYTCRPFTMWVKL